jgi:hypothetical protein
MPVAHPRQEPTCSGRLGDLATGPGARGGRRVRGDSDGWRLTACARSYTPRPRPATASRATEVRRQHGLRRPTPLCHGPSTARPTQIEKHRLGGNRSAPCPLSVRSASAQRPLMMAPIGRSGVRTRRNSDYDTTTVTRRTAAHGATRKALGTGCSVPCSHWACYTPLAAAVSATPATLSSCEPR